MSEPMEQQPQETHILKPHNRAVFKVLKDIKLRQTRSEHHLSLIDKAIGEGIVLNGLRREVRPQIPDQPIDLVIKWEQAHLDFGLKLQTLLKEYWTDKITTYQNDIADTIQRIPQVNQLPDQAELDYILAHLKELSVKESARLEAPKPKATQWNKRRKVQTKRGRNQNVTSTVERNGGE
jgi:hypothetical protein